MRSRLRCHARAARWQVCAHLEVLEHAHALEHLPSFRDVRDAEAGTLGRRYSQQIGSFINDAPGQRLHGAGDRLEQRRLARAVGSDDRDELARADRQRDVVQRSRTAVGDAQ